jgi:thiol-disulfide isomerase/thioredoxin
MSGILYLNADDFVVKKAEKGNLLCLNYDNQGLSLVLFYSNECQHCNKLMIKYKQLPFNINGCQFTMINVNRPDNRKVVQMSNHTIVPITYVPDIILYVDGVPYMRYDGPHEIQSIKSFIVEIYQQLQKTAFMDSKTNAHPPSSQSTMYGRGGQAQSVNSHPQERPLTGKHPGLPQQRQDTNMPVNTSVNHANHGGHGSQDIQQKKNAIPAYTIGKPKCSGERDDVCYLSFNQAYQSSSSAPTNQQQQQQQQQQPVFYNSPPGIMQH